MATETVPFEPPMDSAIRVRDIPNTTIVRTGFDHYALGAGDGIMFSYQIDDLAYVYLAAPGRHGGRWVAQWAPTRGDGKYAEDLTAKDALRSALWPLAQIDRAVAHSVMAALLARKTEYTWRGAINPETIAAAWDDALDLNAETCSAHCDAVEARPCEHQITAAARRVAGLRSAADLERAR